jgi:Hypoxia induced protein conserved region
MNIAILAFIIMTFIVLIVGVVIMATGNKKLNAKYSNKLMSLRVAFQAIAIVLLALMYFLGKRGG